MENPYETTDFVKTSKVWLKSYRLMQLSFIDFRSVSLKGKNSYLWGFDIWVGNIPFLKTLTLCNVLVWLIFAF